MNPYKTEILKDQYEDHFRTAERRRDEDRPLRAARSYERAADALAQLAAEGDEDREEEIERLRRAAEVLRDGDSLENHFKHARGRRDADDESFGERREPIRDGTDADSEMRKQMESFICETETAWDDIGGLEPVQRDLKRAIALGTIGNKPDAVSATDRMLLFGPPGTGKTLLASAVAGSLDANFFKVELGNLLSKWYGESSKQISALFETAADLSPSVIFLDEVDALTQSRSSEMNETSRRVLDTLLAELDGVEKSGDEFVLTLAATNTPWSLDPAIRSRFPQRIHVPLPDEAASTEIVRIHTVDGGVEFEGAPEAFVPDEAPAGDVDGPETAIAKACVDRGYTGRDIEALCREAVNNMIIRCNPNLARLADEGIDRLQNYSLDIEGLQPRDFHHAFETTSSSLPEEDVVRFYEWNDEFGTGIDVR